MRAFSTTRDVRAGCFNCRGSDALWRGKNAQGVAVRHHDATGHQTWVDVTMSIVYGRSAPKEQHGAQLSLPTPPASAPKPRRRR